MQRDVTFVLVLALVVYLVWVCSGVIFASPVGP